MYAELIALLLGFENAARPKNGCETANLGQAIPMLRDLQTTPEAFGPLSESLVAGGSSGRLPCTRMRVDAG